MATNHTMDWDECLICQGEKNENLRGRDEGGSYATLSTLLPKFASIGAFSLEKFGCENDSPATIEAKFKENRAVYHKSCVSDYSKLKLERATKKYDKEERKIWKGKSTFKGELVTFSLNYLLSFLIGNFFS